MNDLHFVFDAPSLWRKMRAYSVSLFITLPLCLIANAQTHNEQGDAGDLPHNAQRVETEGCPPLLRIVGSLTANDVDMYLITIRNPTAFRASTVGGATWDTQLWLFSTEGMGVTFNDDAPPGLQSIITGQFITQPGNYLLAISRFDRDAVDSQGSLLWNSMPFIIERPPDGPGAMNPIAGWLGSTIAAGAYTIFLEGASYFHTGSGIGNPDINRDGCVDQLDLDAWQARMFQECDCCPEDIDGDGFVGEDDLLILIYHWGEGCEQNRPPVARDDSYSTALNTTLTVNAPGVLGNDTEPENETMTAVLANNVSQGNLTLNGNGSFTYTPNLNFCGTDSFTYRARDPQNNTSGIATVTIQINAPDLIMAALGTPGNDGSRISARVRNNGVGVVHAGVNVQFYLGDSAENGSVLLGTQATTTDLGAGQFEDVILGLAGTPFTSGSLVTIIIDSDNQICEINEENNRFVGEAVYTTGPYDIWAWSQSTSYLSSFGSLIALNEASLKYRIFGEGLMDPDTGMSMEGESLGMTLSRDGTLYLAIRRDSDPLLATFYSLPIANIQLNNERLINNLTLVSQFALNDRQMRGLAIGCDENLYFSLANSGGGDLGMWRYRLNSNTLERVGTFQAGQGRFYGDLAFDPCSEQSESSGGLIGWGYPFNSNNPGLYRLPRRFDGISFGALDGLNASFRWRYYRSEWLGYSPAAALGLPTGLAISASRDLVYSTYANGTGLYAHVRNAPTNITIIPNTLIGVKGDLASRLVGDPLCPDTNGDGILDDEDLLNVLFDFGRPPSGNRGRTDLNCDGIVDDADLLPILLRFGQQCANEC